MAIEIKELVIRATVGDDSGGKSQQLMSKEGGGKEEIIAECVEQVIQILKQKEDR